MNILNLIKRSSAHVPDRLSPADEQLERTRRAWLDALVVDETRAWLTLGETAPAVTHGLNTLLTMAGFAAFHESRRIDSADLRAIRAGVKAAEQCAIAGNVLTPAHARALSLGAQRAKAVIERASRDAIVHAAMTMSRSIKTANR
ncbi:MAG: hypothetical protein AB9M53_00725 [Leptothrix sp. (in: b-proteobacteria)]